MTVPSEVLVHGTPNVPAAPADNQVATQCFEVDFLPADIHVGQMRRIATAVLRLWDLTALTDTTALVVSELVTNAVLHCGGRPVKVRLMRAGRELRVEVTDGAHEPARLYCAKADDEHGRGLLLVAAVARRWGVSPDGTTTWCCLVISGESS